MTELDPLLDLLSSKPGAVEERPFGPGALVFKVMGKMFALVMVDDEPLRMNLKCVPHLALALREQYDAVAPGYHMNKRHWNTVTLDGSIPEADLRDMVDLSYDLVVAGLTRAAREELNLSTYEVHGSNAGQNGDAPADRLDER